MERIGVLPHPAKAPALAMARELIEHLEERAIEVWLEGDAAALLDRTDLAGPLPQLDAGIVLGGDGAFLRAGRRLAVAGIPLLGVNYGHLGFLTEIEPEQIKWAIDRLIGGEYRIEERFMLRASVVREGEVVSRYDAMNDVVVARGTLARIVTCHLYIDGSFVGVYRGDGMIVATPTGSTAYSLSAGGPILHPDMAAVVVTPICPHTMGARSMVTAPDHCVTLRFPSSSDELLLTVDGQYGDALQPGDEVRIEKAAQRTRLIRLHDRTFYDILRSRLSQHFGEDLRAVGDEQ